MNIREQAMEYIGIGLDAIPLREGQKLPVHDSWQELEPEYQWDGVGEEANIALRQGNGRFFIDADDQKAVQNVLFLLSEHGVSDYPMVKTKRGFHIYLCNDKPFENANASWENLDPTVGDGELRYGVGAYGVVPQSVVAGNPYQLVQGSFSSIPVIDPAILEPLRKDKVRLTPTGVSTNGNAQKPALDISSLPEHTQRLIGGKVMHLLKSGKSRSEVDAQIMLVLISNGMTYPEVLWVFENYPTSGKYWKEKREDYLQTTYKNTHAYYTQVAIRLQTKVEDARTVAVNHDFSGGRTGRTDRLVYLALLDKVEEVGKERVQASERELSRRSTKTRKTTRHAVGRLIKQGLLSVVEDANGWDANEYAVSLLEKCKETTPYIDTAYCGIWGKNFTVVNHPAFYRGALGDSAAQVYLFLLQNPDSSVTAIAEGAGVSRPTVYNALDKMQGILDIHTGELLSLVEKDGRTWKAVEVDLDLIAEIYGTSNKQIELEHKYERERAEWRAGHRKHHQDKEYEAAMRTMQAGKKHG